MKRKWDHAIDLCMMESVLISKTVIMRIYSTSFSQELPVYIKSIPNITLDTDVIWGAMPIHEKKVKHYEEI